MYFFLKFLIGLAISDEKEAFCLFLKQYLQFLLVFVWTFYYSWT